MSNETKKVMAKIVVKVLNVADVIVLHQKMFLTF